MTNNGIKPIEHKGLIYYPLETNGRTQLGDLLCYRRSAVGGGVFTAYATINANNVNIPASYWHEYHPFRARVARSVVALPLP